MKKSIYIILFIAAPLFSLGQNDNVWTLQECVDYALEHNLDIRQSLKNVENSSINLNQSKYSLYPSLNGSSSFQNNWGRSIDPTTNDFITQQINFLSFSANSSVTLFNGNVLRNQIKRDEQELRASQFDFDNSKDLISMGIVQNYMNVIFNTELYENAKAQLSSTTQQVNRTKIQVDVGALPISNLLELQATQATNELNVINQENALNFSLLQLKQMMQLPASTDVQIEVPALDIENLSSDEASVEQIFSIALENMPQIKAAEHRKLSSEIGVKIAKGNMYPSLLATGGLSTNFSSAADRQRFVPDGGDPTVVTNPQIGFVEGSNAVVRSLGEQVIPSGEFVDSYGVGPQLGDNINWFAGVRMSIPIFNGMSTHSNIQRSIVNNDRSNLAWIQAKNDLRQNIETAYNDAIAAAKTYTSSEKQVLAREEAFRVVSQRFNLGAADFVEYQVAENDLFGARSDLLRAKYDLIYKKKVLDFYQGKKIEF